MIMLKSQGLSIITAAVTLAVSVWNPGASAASPAQTTVKQLVSIFSSLPESGRDPGVWQQAANYIDYRLMTEQAFTREQWQALSPSQRQQLKDRMQALLQQRYYPRWRRIFSRSELAVVSESGSGGESYVTTRVSRGKKSDTVIWRLHAGDGQYQVVSLNVNGKDLSKRLAANCQRQFKRAGYGGTLAWLRSKSASQ